MNNLSNSPANLAYLSLLRGINVGGHHKIRMADLKALYESIGFKNIQTYIQSGNVLFEADHLLPETSIAQIISNAIADKYGFRIPIIVRTAQEMKQIVAQNPFLKNLDDNTTDSRDKCHLTLLATAPAAAAIAAATHKASTWPDKFVVIDRNIYLHCTGSYSDSKLSNSFFETQFQTQATTRNLKTVLQLCHMLDKMTENI